MLVCVPVLVRTVRVRVATVMRVRVAAVMAVSMAVRRTRRARQIVEELYRLGHLDLQACTAHV